MNQVQIKKKKAILAPFRSRSISVGDYAGERHWREDVANKLNELVKAFNNLPQNDL
jgi:hypothetical protein